MCDCVCGGGINKVNSVYIGAVSNLKELVSFYVKFKRNVFFNFKLFLHFQQEHEAIK